MEHQADVHPQLRLILPDAGPGCEKNGRRATWAVTTRSGRHQVPVAVLPTAKSLSASLKPQSDRLLESSLCLSMILSENRFPLFRIMLSSHRFDSMTPQKPLAARAQITPAGLMFLAITSIGWGFNWPVTKYLLSELPPLTMRGSSGVVGAALLAGPSGLRRPNLPLPPRMWL